MMDNLFTPEKVAVVGASRHEGKTGHEVFDNLLHEFEGEVVPVNPKADEVSGVRAEEEVPSDTDLAVYVVPAKIVVDSLKQAASDIDAAVVISAGFSEAGEKELEDELVEICDENNVDLLGPNVLGIINTENGLNASFASKTPEKGSISFTSQSGAFCTAVLDYAKAEHIGFRHFVSLGNKARIGESDLLELWKNDGKTETVMGYTEGIKDGRAFMQRASELSEEKPIVMVKSGRTDEGGEAASSHTGSIAGSYEAYSAAFKQTGIVEAESNRELLDFARCFSYQPLPENDSIAVVTNAGGPGVVTADEISEHGMELAEFRDSTTRMLEDALPEEAEARNPVDVIGDAGHERYTKTLEAVLQDENVGSAIVLLTPQANTEIEKTAKAVVNCSERFDKPVAAVFMGEDDVNKGIKILERNDVPEFQDPVDAVKSLKRMLEYRKWREEDNTFRDVERNEKKASEILKDLETFEDMEELLKTYKFDLPLSKLCETPRDATEAAGKVGFPAVAKIDSPTISHKTEVDGVETGLGSKTEVEDAFKQLVESVYHAENGQGTEINGVLVQEQIDGLEVALGLNRDPQFGPVVMVGLGGIYVEALHDVSFGVAPISEEYAEKMIHELRSHELFEGVRGEEYSLEALKDAIIRMGQIGLDYEEVKSVDVNPLILTEERAFAADIEVETD